MIHAQAQEKLEEVELREVWYILSSQERLEGFRCLSQTDAEEFFFSLNSRDQSELIITLPPEERRIWMRSLPPDDAADLIQHTLVEYQDDLLQLLDTSTFKEVRALLAYAQDQAGGLMNPRFARVRPDMTVDEAITYLRKQTREYLESIYYIYVLDDQQNLLGVVSLRELIKASPEKTVRDVMVKDLITVDEEQDQEKLGRLFSKSGLIAIPVLDEQGHMKGIVTADDIVQVVQEEATEDIQKLGGMEALDTPYLQTSMRDMIKKRAGWLVLLFLGEMLTATAMGFFQDAIAKAVMLALFIPLIISSGGNSGSQATTLVIRALALGEIRLRDWWRVVRREILIGFYMGLILGTIGFFRIVLWQQFRPIYGEHYGMLAFVIFVSLAGVVSFGTLTGSFLPFVMKKLGFDPASASAPFVATLVDVSGVLIYFSIASALLRGGLL